MSRFDLDITVCEFNQHIHINILILKRVCMNVRRASFNAML